jgi:hypothetical protein
MASKGLVAQAIRAAPSAPISKSIIAPTVLPVCCICRKIRDETESSPDREHWVTQRAYRKTHGINPVDFPLTHTYCLKCFRKFQNTVRECYREIRPSP